MKKKYQITFAFKIFIAQFALSFIGLIIGCTWGLNGENKTWSQFINNDVISVASGVKSEANSKDIPKVINDPTAVEPPVVEKAKTKEDKDKEALSQINTCISSFSTSLGASSTTRINNIEVCTKAINGKILMPGEIFSFNEVVGKRTKERGYKEAPVIVNNKVESGLGGGICQVSSTLYNAVLIAGIQSIDRTHHSVPSEYVDLGLDATVDWENIDFKFTNTLQYPIYIEGQIKNNNLYVNILSNSKLSAKKYIIENSILEEGNVCEAKVTRKTYENGSFVNSEAISDDTYMASSLLKKNDKKY